MLLFLIILAVLVIAFTVEGGCLLLSLAVLIYELCK